jgi:hypothetical protein
MFSAVILPVKRIVRWPNSSLVRGENPRHRFKRTQHIPDVLPFVIRRYVTSEESSDFETGTLS